MRTTTGRNGAVSALEPRIYSVEVIFTQLPSLSRFARDPNITPDASPEIEEDSWGILDSLEIWFQEVDERGLTLHIQRAHFKRHETYIKDLQHFLEDIIALEYVERIHVK
jgi:hypothetical protein